MAKLRMCGFHLFQDRIRPIFGRRNYIFLDGKWYIYYAADDGQNENHRMFVLESETDDPLGEYVDKGMMDTSGRWAIDGTTLQKEDGSLYFIWSGWEGTENVASNCILHR